MVVDSTLRLGLEMLMHQGNMHFSGQFIATSAEVTPNGGLVTGLRVSAQADPLECSGKAEKWWFSKGIPSKMALNQVKDL